MTKKRVLVTGGTGFVGANLARSLLKSGHQVYLLVRPGFAPWRIWEIRRDIVLKQVDLNDELKLTRVVKLIKPEWIFHLATYGAYSSQADPGQMITTNVNGTLHLLHACLKSGFESFVNTSSSSEYGFAANAPGETQIPQPNSYYAVTKTAATLLCGFLARQHKAYIPTLRLYSVYGPFEEPTRLMPKLLLYAQKGKLPPLADPEISRDFIYAEDVCAAFVAAAGHKGRDNSPVYNVGTGRQTSLKKLVALVKKTFAVAEVPEWSSMPNRSWDTTVWRANITKICRELNWQPKWSLRSGLVAMEGWLRQLKWQKIYLKNHKS